MNVSKYLLKPILIDNDENFLDIKKKSRIKTEKSRKHKKIKIRQLPHNM